MSLKPFVRLALLGCVPLAAACGGGEKPAAAPETQAAAPAAAPAASAGTASVSGKIAFSGTAPAPEKIKLSADPKCAAMHKDGLERAPIHVKDGGLADVLVYVKSGANGSYPAPAEDVLLDQHGCDC